MIGRSAEGDMYITNHEDSILLGALTKGSLKAFDALYMKYSPAVVMFAAKILGNTEDAEDVCQSVFLRIWEKRASLTAVHSFRNYLYTAVRNAVCDKLARRLRSSHNFSEAFLSEIYSEDAQKRYEAKDLATIASLAISSMPEERRKVFELSRYKGLSYNEISKSLGISVKTVEYHISRSLADLRLILAEI